MFKFLYDAPYEQRKVARDDFDWGYISTASVNDGAHPYETAVLHNQYERMVIVEAYDTKEEAIEGHNRWVVRMTEDELPERLEDCANSEVAVAILEMGGCLDEERKS